MSDLNYWIERARWASTFGYPSKEAYARRKIKQIRTARETAHHPRDRTNSAGRTEPENPAAISGSEADAPTLSGSGVVED